jgi:4-hydroxy-tetrahydrodipicolinate synthase
MAEVANPIGLVLYNPPHAKIKLSPEDFHQLKKARIPLVRCKLSGGDEKWFASMQKFFPGISLFVPGHQLATGIRLGAYGSYSNVACLHPGVAQKWYEMMNSDIELALEVEERMQLFFHNYIIPFITEKNFSGPAIDKFLAVVGGWANIGTRLRWPYKWIDKKEVDKMRNWKGYNSRIF